MYRCLHYKSQNHLLWQHKERSPETKESGTQKVERWITRIWLPLDSTTWWIIRLSTRIIVAIQPMGWCHVAHQNIHPDGHLGWGLLYDSAPPWFGGLEHAHCSLHRERGNTHWELRGGKWVSVRCMTWQLGGNLRHFIITLSRYLQTLNSVVSHPWQPKCTSYYGVS